MATRAKDGHAHTKDRSSTSHSMPHNADSGNARRPQRTSVSASPNKDATSPSEKSVPSYLRPTLSSKNEPQKHLKKQKSEGSTMRRLTTTRSFGGNPPSSQPQKPLPSTAASKEKSVKTSSSSSHAPRVATSTAMRTVAPKTTVKTVGIGKGKNIRKETGGVKKRETKQSPATSTTGGEEKEVIHDVAAEEPKHGDEEHEQVEVFLVEDEAHAYSQAAEPGINVQACDTSASLEQELENATQEIEDRNDEKCQKAQELNHQDRDRDREALHDGEPQDIEEHLPIKEQEVTDGEQAEEGFEEISQMKTAAVVTESSKGKREIENDSNEGSDVKGIEEDVNNLREELEAKAIGEKLEAKAIGEELEAKAIGEELEAKAIGGELEAKAIGEELEAKVIGEVLEPKVEENTVPKHKDVRGKKEAQAAYNDVIEETASKLAEQRKSKVKALAGAFETVISLQNPEG